MHTFSFFSWNTSKLLFVAGVFFCIFSIPIVSHAALLYLDPNVAEISRGDTVTVSLRIIPDGSECINAVNSVITFDPAIKAVDISTGQSIFNVWVENPKINAEAHTVSFAGGITNGYCGRIQGDPSFSNIILEIVFRSPGFSIVGTDTGEARVTIAPASEVLLNDGLGTPATVRTENALFTLLDTPGTEEDDTWKDRVAEDDTPPSDFTITLTKDDTAFSGRYFIAFATQDKQAGLDHYEVMEEPFSQFYTFSWGRADAPWVRAESPYILKDQTLNSTIRVKAIDKAGNETIAVLVPDEALRAASTPRLVFAVVMGLVVALILGGITYFLVQRKKRILETYTHDDIA